MRQKQLQLVTFEQAKKLKNCGFDWPVKYCYYPLCPLEDGGYETDVEPEEDIFDHNSGEGVGEEYAFSAPDASLALKWFRDEKNIANSVEMTRTVRNGESIEKYRHVYIFEKCHVNGIKEFDSYEEAESALLDELLNILEK